MNNMIKDVGLILIAVVGALMIIVRLSVDSPSNTFLAITGLITVVSLIGYLVMNYFMEDE